MGDWADIESKDIVTKYYTCHYGNLDWLADAFAAALRNERSESEAEGRRNAIERSAALIGRQVEAKSGWKEVAGEPKD